MNKIVNTVTSMAAGSLLTMGCIVAMKKNKNMLDVIIEEIETIK